MRKYGMLVCSETLQKVKLSMLHRYDLTFYVYTAKTPPHPSSSASVSSMLTEEMENTGEIFLKLKFSMSDSVPPEMQLAITKQIQIHGG